MRIETLAAVGCTIFSLFASAHRAGAWSGAGHEVIAAEAWRELSPELKAKVGELLKSHPDYSKWEASFTAGVPGVDVAAHAFLQASSWPDKIRRRGNQYDHPHWHYVDYPLKPTAFPMEPAPTPDDDVLFGITECEKVLSDSKAPAQERAAYLSWLIHLVGDIHQPLHCASLFSEAYPAGDKGGNSFYIKPGGRGINLHSFWDGLLGTSGKEQSHFNYAVQIATGHPRRALPELTKDKTPKAWSIEGRTLAIEKCYLRGSLKGGTNAETAQPLPEGYTKNAKEVAEKQAALAGYRLADAISRVLK